MKRKDNVIGRLVRRDGYWKRKPEPLLIDRKERPIGVVSNVRAIEERRETPKVSPGTGFYICAGPAYHFSGSRLIRKPNVKLRSLILKGEMASSKRVCLF